MASNIVVYLSENWDDQDGGALCLFNETGQKVEKRVPCQLNRAAIFAANPISYHGVEPLKASAKQKRHSLYFAYYSVKGGTQSIEGVPGIYGKNEKSNSYVHYETYFILPWHQLLKRKNWAHLKIRLRSTLKLFLPPIVLLMSRALKNLAQKH